MKPQRGYEDGGFEYQRAKRQAAGDHELVFDFLEEHYKNRHGLITNLKVHQMYDGIRSDPRYFEYLKKLGLPL